MFNGLCQIDKVTFSSMIQCVSSFLVGSVIRAILVLGLFIFTWNLVKFISNRDDTKAREESKKYMFWAVIGLVVMFAFWGLVQILSSTLGQNVGVVQIQVR